MSPITCPLAILLANVVPMKFNKSCASGKNLAIESLALKKIKSSGDIAPNVASNAASSSVNAYFAQRLFVENNLMYHDSQSLTRLLIAPSSWIFPVTGSLFAKNLLKSDSFPSPITTVPIFGSMTRYFTLLSPSL